VSLANSHRPSLILLEVDLDGTDGYEVCRTLRSSAVTAKVPILIYSARTEVADKVAGFKAGANDYIVKPAAPAELVVRIRAALHTEEQTLAYTVAIWGTKGGVGSTTIASNLALLLQSKTNKRVTLMDASAYGGTLGVVLNLAPMHTIADLLPRLDELDSELLSSVLSQHSSGVKVLLSMLWNENHTRIQSQEYERILSWLQAANDYVIVDTSPVLDDNTQAILQSSSQVIMVLTPEMTSLRNARVFLQEVEDWGKSEDKFLFVLNRYPVKSGLQLKDIETALRRKITIQIPDDAPLVTYSINRGIPLVISHAKSPIAQSYSQLAAMLIASSSKKQSADEGQTGRSRFSFGRS